MSFVIKTLQRTETSSQHTETSLIAADTLEPNVLFQLEVAVVHVAVVAVRERRQQLAEHAHGVALAHLAVVQQVLEQVRAVHELVHDAQPVRRLVRTEVLDHVRVVQRLGNLHLGHDLEQPPPRAVYGLLLRRAALRHHRPPRLYQRRLVKHLDRHLAARPRVHSRVHVRRRAAAEQAAELELLTTKRFNHSNVRRLSTWNWKTIYDNTAPFASAPPR